MNLMNKACLSFIAILISMHVGYSFGMNKSEAGALVAAVADAAGLQKPADKHDFADTRDMVAEYGNDDARSLFDEQTRAIKQRISLLKQAKQVEQLKATLEDMRDDSELGTHKNSAIAKKTTKVISGLLDRIDTVLSVGVPIVSVMLFIAVYRAIAEFTGVGGRSINPQPTYIRECDTKTGECRNIMLRGDQAPYQQACTSFFPFTLVDPNCHFWS